jgi:hypothetical protein
VWLRSDANMVVKPLNDILPHGKIETTWYKGITAKVSATDTLNKEQNLYWWIVLNRTATKGLHVLDWRRFIGDREYHMYEDELIIELQEVLKDGQGHEFVALKNGKSFYCEKDNKRPFIRITRKMLDSIGFNGDSITLKVYYYNYKSDPKLISDSLTIKNHN